MPSLAIHCIAAENAQRERVASFVKNSDGFIDAETWAKLPNGGFMARIIDGIAKAIRDQAATPLHQPTGAAADVAAPERN